MVNTALIHSNICSIRTVILFTVDNDIARGIEKFEWHIYNFGFCNDISAICELDNGIDPINRMRYGVLGGSNAQFYT